MSELGFKNARVIRSEWLYEDGRRLDCNPYMSGALEARDALKRLPVTEKLVDVTKRIFHAGREGRIWVEDPKYGVPFMGSSDIRVADFSQLPLIAKKQVERNPLFALEEGWTLITRSGTIGRMAYARNDMAGMACSEHVLRVVPDSQRIPPGYLYAFLSSRYGVPLVVSGTYGAIIQHIEPHHIANLPIPRLVNEIEERVDDFVKSAATARIKALSLHRQAKDLLNFTLGFSENLSLKSREFSIASTSSNKVLRRMDATFHDGFAQKSDFCINQTNAEFTLYELGIRSSETGRIKQIFTEPEFGVPFYTSGQIFNVRMDPDRYLSRGLLKLNENVLVKFGDVLIARSGQVGGIIGRGVWADRRFVDSCVSVDVLRLDTRNAKVKPGYVFAFLCLTDIGYRQLIRGASGSSIPHLNADDVLNIKLPRCGINVEESIASLVEKSGEFLAYAQDAENKAWKLVEEAIGGDRVG